MVNRIVLMLSASLLLAGLADARVFPIPKVASLIAKTNLQSELFAFQESPDPQKIEKYIGSIDTFFTKADDTTITRAFPTIAGWLAGVFIRFPYHVGDWISPRRSRATSAVIAWALSITGHTKEAEEIAKQEGVDLEKMSPELRNIAVLMSTPNDPVSLDLLWGAAFATGDKVYVANIASTIDKPEGGKYFDPLKELLSGQRSLSSFGDQLDRRAYAELAVKYAAVSLLAANAVDYAFVGSAVEDYIADSSKSIEARELLRFAVKISKDREIQ